MKFPCIFSAAFILLNAALVSSLVTDELCFSQSSSRILEKTSRDADLDFHRSLSKLSQRPFSLALRYCLGRNGEASSHEFIECVKSLSECPLSWHSTINWDFCLCNTVHCIFKGCFKQWVETLNFKDTKCFGRCITDSYSCILKQTGKPHFKP